MGEWLRYLLYASVSSALLYLVYAIFLRRDTFFAINRFYLAGSLLVSALLPLFNLPGISPEQTVRYYYVLETIRITPDEVSRVINSHLSLFQVLTIAYLTGVMIFLGRFIVQLVQITWLIRKHGITRTDGLNLVLIHREYSPFSFFHLIFVNARDYRPEQLREVIEHEKVHIRQGHTVDLILLEIITIVLWFNPFIWLYRRSLKGIHEFLADEGVLLRGTAITEYQQMLLNQSLGIQLNDMTNNFNQSLLKRRFMMMYKSKSGRIARLKPLLALPVILMMAAAFSLAGGQVAVAQDSPAPPPKASDEAKAIKTVNASGEEEIVYKEVKTPPQFKGGQTEMVNYIVGNMKYPDEAKKQKIMGTVHVQFIVDKTGKINSPKVLKAVDPALDAEAIRVVSGMPAWIPGKDDQGNPVNVAMTLPIQFRLE